MIAISYHDRVNVLQGTVPEIASPFDREEWFTLLADSGLEPVVPLARSDNAVASLALTRANGRLEPMRNWYSFTWRPGVPQGTDGDNLLRALATDLRKQAHRVTLWPVPDEDGSATRLEQAFATAGWTVRRQQCDYNHVLHINGRSFAEYWAGRSGRMRTTLKRKAKKVDVTLFTSFDPAVWQDYETVYSRSWKPEEGDPALLRRFAQEEGAAGRLRMALAHAGGEPLAAQFWTVEAGTAYIHKLAHTEAAKPLSAGTSLSAALFEHVIDTDRVSLIDFGTGNDPYKADWMEEVRPRFLLDFLDPHQPRAWPALFRQHLQRLAPSKSSV